MPIEAIIARYGIVAVFAGAGFEGETAAIAGGLLAHQGYFTLPAAMAAAALGSFVADQLFFLLGRRFRERRWVRKAQQRPAFARALGLLERYPRAFVFAFRFIYGIRTVSPVAIGTSNVPTRTFIAINAVAAAVWGLLFVGLGFLFGRVIEASFGHLHRMHHLILLVVIALMIAIGAIQTIRWWSNEESE